MTSTSSRLPKITILVTVYRGTEETLCCLAKIATDTQRCYTEVFVIDDCSPEPGLSEAVSAACKNYGYRYLRTASRVGYVKAINIGLGMGAKESDFVLLNNDTQVPNGWLQRLHVHAYSERDIGTVTPLSNNGSICSYPNQAGGLPLAAFSLSEIDEACNKACSQLHVELPTGVGFCLYIRQNCLKAVGHFDDSTFGLGYGEEVDFCLKASKVGFRHIVACDVYVQHTGGVSFGPHSNLKDRAWQILIARYPHYRDAVWSFARQDPLASKCLSISTTLIRNHLGPKTLHITHSLGGGTEEYLNTLVDRDSIRGALILRTLTVGAINILETFPLQLEFPAISPFKIKLNSGSLWQLIDIIKDCGVSKIVLHHTLGFGDDLKHFLTALAVPFTTIIHDYFLICPRIFLFRRAQGGYCGQPDEETCNQCLRESLPANVSSIRNWRESNMWYLRHAGTVLHFTADSANRLSRTPGNHTVEAPENPTEHTSVVTPKLIPYNTALRIGLLGYIAPHKGRDKLARLSTEVQPGAKNARNWSFHVIGQTIPAVMGPNVQETGPYKNSDLPSLIKNLGVHVLWFPAACPETWSFTLTSALQSQLPIVATDLGAFSHRLKEQEWILLIPSDSDWQVWLGAFDKIYNKLVGTVAFNA